MTTALRGEVDQLRLWWVGFTTFIRRAHKDIIRYSVLTIAPPAVMTALYFLVFGELIGRRIGTVSGVDYERYIAPGLVILPVIVNALVKRGIGIKE
jgi:ABC-2 type transport system permease protein